MDTATIPDAIRRLFADSALQRAFLRDPSAVLRDASLDEPARRTLLNLHRRLAMQGADGVGLDEGEKSRWP
jgi:hypothetical protein